MLSLPLPHSTYRAFTVTLVWPANSLPPLVVTVRMPAGGTSTVADLKSSIASMASTWYRRILAAASSPDAFINSSGASALQPAQPSPHRRRPVVMQIDWSAVESVVLPPLQRQDAKSLSLSTDAVSPFDLTLVRAFGHSIISSAPLADTDVLDATIKDAEQAVLVAYVVPSSRAGKELYERGVSAVALALVQAAETYPLPVHVSGGTSTDATCIGGGVDDLSPVGCDLYSRLRPEVVVGSPVVVRVPADAEGLADSWVPAVVTGIVEHRQAQQRQQLQQLRAAPAPLKYDIRFDADGSEFLNCDAENIASRVPAPVHLILSHRSFVYPRSGQAPFAAAPLRAVTAARTGPTHSATGTELINGVTVPVTTTNIRLPGTGGGASLHAFGGPAGVPPAAGPDALYFLSSLSTAPFGMPFILAALPGLTTGESLYARVASHSQRFIRRPLPSRAVSESATVSSGVDREMRVMTHWGFTLRRTNRTSGACSVCAWVMRCRGCLVPPEAAPIRSLQNWESISVEWDPALLEQAFDRRAAVARSLHSSVVESLAAEARVHSLEQARLASGT